MDNPGVLRAFNDLFMTVMIALFATSVAGLLQEVFCNCIWAERTAFVSRAQSTGWQHIWPLGQTRIMLCVAYSGSSDCSDYAYDETLRRAQDHNRTAQSDFIFMQIPAPRVS